MRIAEGEAQSVGDKGQSPQLNDHFFSQETAPAFSTTKGHTSTSAEKERIARYTGEVFELVSKYATEYGVSEQEMLTTLKCESGYRHDGVYGDSGLAYGIAQFHEATFNSFKKAAGMPELDYMDREDQIHLMAWAFSRGLKRHWTCATKNGIL